MSTTKNITLTKEQEAKIPKYLKTWEKIAFATDRAKWIKADRALKRIYKDSKFKNPKQIFHCQSPAQMIYLAGAAKRVIEGEGNFDTDLVSIIPDVNSRPEVYAAASFFYLYCFPNNKHYVKGVSILQTSPENPKDALSFFGDSFKLHIISEILKAGFNKRKPDEVLKEIESLELTKEAWNELIKQVRKSSLHYLNSGLLYGLHDAAWLAVYKFFAVELNMKEETAKFPGLWTLSKVAGWAIPCDKNGFICDKPCAMEQDENKNPHCETGAAIAWTDGFGAYTLHNIHVEARFLLQPETITVKDILAQTNAEIRRVLIEKYGMEKFLKDGEYKEFAKDSYGVLYENPKIDSEDTMGLRRLLRLEDSTPDERGVREVYIQSMPVRHPQTQALLDTPHNCVCWSFDLPEGAYAPLIET